MGVQNPAGADVAEAACPVRTGRGLPVEHFRHLRVQSRLDCTGGGFLKDGRIYDNYYVMVLQFKDRLLHELREYMDTYYVNSLKLSA
jgi:hypothetical protein